MSLSTVPWCLLQWSHSEFNWHWFLCTWHEKDMLKLSFHEPFSINDEYKHIVAQPSTATCVSIALDVPILTFEWALVLHSIWQTGNIIKENLRIQCTKIETLSCNAYVSLKVTGTVQIYILMESAMNKVYTRMMIAVT